MFSQASVCSTQGGGEVTPNASWDRSHGHGGEVVWIWAGGGLAMGGGGPAVGGVVWPWGEVVQP